jgi:hypothetical protein
VYLLVAAFFGIHTAAHSKHTVVLSQAGSRISHLEEPGIYFAGHFFGGAGIRQHSTKSC